MRLTNPRTEIALSRPRRGGAVLATVLLSCVLLLSAQAPARGGRGTVLQTWVLAAAEPLARGVAAVSRATSSGADQIGATLQARSENVRLRETLAQRDRELFRLRAELQQLTRESRLLTSAEALPRIVTSAPVLLMQSRAGLQSAVIGAGRGRGVVAGSPIAVPEGLVGRVVAAGSRISRAQLLLDASAAAGARIVRTGELGVIRGDGRGALRLNNVPTSSRVRAGDVIESAGIDGIYPRGVVIGRVAEVSRGGNLFLEIRVRPAAPFARLTDVLVLAPSPAAAEPLEGTRGAGH
jgi:rod shape-determining protein MreC